MTKAIRLLGGILCGALLFAGTGSFDYSNVYADADEKTAIVGGLETESGSTEEIKSYVVGEDTLPYTEDELYEQLFDIHNKVSVNLDMSNEEMAKLEADYEKNQKSPIYRMADITFTIALEDGSVYSYTIKEVGVRMKGNMTRNKFYNSQTNSVYDLIHYKVSFKETFDDTGDGYGENEYYLENGESKWKQTDEGKAARKERKNRTFAGMEKLDLKWNGNYDNTYLREYYAYEIYRSEGVWAPHMNLCSMDFGDVDAGNTYHLGVYTIHECIDEVFMNRCLTDETDRGGDLYKAAWTNNGADFTSSVSMGISDDFTGTEYNYDLKTNKKTSDFSSLKNVISVLNGSGLTKEKFESVVDTDSFVKFAAVSYFLGNPDDLRNNFNNYYVYVYPSTSSNAGKAVLIPYDYDRCLGVTVGWNPDGTGMTGVSPISTTADGIKRTQNNPLYKYGIGANGFVLEEYEDALDEVYENELLTTDAFREVYNIAENLYKDDAPISDNLELADYNSTAGGGRWTAKERISKFVFSMGDDEETEDYSSSRSNITVENYITAIKETYNKYLENRNLEDGYYIGTAENGWSPAKGYYMSYDETSGVYTYTWEVVEQTAFMIVNTNGDFYRYGAVTGTLPEGVSSNLASSIVLEPGTYVIKMNDFTKKITISLPGDEVSVKLTLNANGGKIGSSSTKSKTVVYGKKIGTLKKPVKKGYSFDGWYTKKSGGKKVTSVTKCTYKKNTTLYAHWTKTSVGKANIKQLTNSASATVKVTVGKVTGAAGYRVDYSVNKNFSSKKSVTSGGRNIKLTGLKKGKTYYIRVRAYKKDSTGAKVYGKYSAVKKIKVKK